MAEYNSDYPKACLDDFIKQYDDDYETAKYSIIIDGDFSDPPLLKFCQYLNKADDIEYMDLMVRYCIVGKNVTINLDGEKIGTFRLNNINDDWSVIPYFALDQHPLAYNVLCNIVGGYLTKKSMPPKKKTSAVVATQI